MLKLPEKLVLLRNRLNNHGYIELYNNERTLNVALALGWFGEEGVREINTALSLLSTEEQCMELSDLIELEDELNLDGLFPGTEEQQRQSYSN